MGRFIKNVFIFLGVLILSLAILYFLVQDKKSQENVLHSSLSLFGERLLAMIPQQSEKESVKEKYDEFVKKAAEKEVPPEKIEIVTSEILNASTTNETLAAEDAKELLDFALEPQEEYGPISGIESDFEVDSATHKYETQAAVVIADEKLMELGKMTISEAYPYLKINGWSPTTLDRWCR